LIIFDRKIKKNQGSSIYCKNLNCMETSQIYIAISIIVLTIIALLVAFFSRSSNKKKITPLAGLAFGFVLAGLFCGERRYIGYGLIGIGIVLSVIDILIKFRGNNHEN
jgi:hypothetical protein